jgi:DNA-directed RNA polymerase subunit RPC12/RpoP
MTSRKEIFCRSCKSKLGVADYDDFYLVGQTKPIQDRVIVCPVCGWKRTWNFAKEPKSTKKKFTDLNARANKALYGIKALSETQREWFEEDRRLEREQERRIEEQEEERRLERERERRIERMRNDSD